MDKPPEKNRKRSSIIVVVGAILIGLAVGITFVQITELYACEDDVTELLELIKETKAFYDDQEVPLEVPLQKRIEFEMLAQQIVDEECVNDSISITWQKIDKETGELISEEVFTTEPRWEKKN